VTFNDAQTVLATAGVQIDPGLTENEFLRVERRFGFQFPPDLREFLSTGLPVSGRWVDWRSVDEAAIRKRLEWPIEGICFDIEHNAFWLAEWGARPSNLREAFEVARRAVAEAPVLIPIYSHRYIPAVPSESGNPVFSVYQTDIIYYGADLMDYLQNEFSYHFGRAEYSVAKTPRRIAFWSRLAGENGEPGAASETEPGTS
jgi:hypothetical protein